MTNYVLNRWLVAGSEAELDAFEALVLTPSAPGPSLVGRLLGRSSPPRPRGPDLDAILPSPKGLPDAALAEWRLAHWGVQREAEPESYDRGPGRAVLAFATPWSHPEGIVRALAPRLPPGLIVEGAYVEPGNEYAGRFRLARGVCEDREVPFTPEFYEEVSGEPLDD